MLHSGITSVMSDSQASESSTSTTTDYSYYGDLDDTISEEVFGWKCFICEQWAKSGIKLENQFIEASTVTVVDSDGKRWLRCDNCGLSCHINCLNFVKIKGKLYKRFTLVVPEVTWEVIEKNGRFTCCTGS